MGVDLAWKSWPVDWLTGWLSHWTAGLSVLHDPDAEVKVAGWNEACVKAQQKLPSVIYKSWMPVEIKWINVRRNTTVFSNCWRKQLHVKGYIAERNGMSSWEWQGIVTFCACQWDEWICVLEQRFSNFFQVGTTFISQNVLRTTLLLNVLSIY
jgi:hypothetical protein